jgi:methionyl aminopeptidase
MDAERMPQKRPMTVKSPREIKLMRTAGLIVWEAHQEAAKVVAPGVNTMEIEEAIAGVFEKYDAIPLFKGVPGPFPFPTVTCVSVNEEVVHGIPGKRTLKEGDIVSIDTGCMVKGWCSDAAVTHPVGEVSAEVQQLLDVTKGTLDLAIELLKTKSFWSEVAAEMARFVRQAKFSVVEDFVGHGIGKDLHEEPKVPNFDSRQLRESDIKLRQGLVLAIEPMVNLGSKRVRCRKDGWTQVTTDGQPSAHFEHTIALTADGPMLLTGPPTGDEIEDSG